MRVSSVCTSSSRAASRAVVASLTASALDHSRAVVDDKDAHDAVAVRPLLLRQFAAAKQAAHQCAANSRAAIIAVVAVVVTSLSLLKTELPTLLDCKHLVDGHHVVQESNSVLHF
jgi:hypothetical protein